MTAAMRTAQNNMSQTSLFGDVCLETLPESSMGAYAPSGLVPWGFVRTLSNRLGPGIGTTLHITIPLKAWGAR
jgi:hypothetical protein